MHQITLIRCLWVHCLGVLLVNANINFLKNCHFLLLRIALEIRQLPLAEIDYWKLKYKMFERLYKQVGAEREINSVLEHC